MALPQQLKSARMTNDTIGLNIDNEVGNLEKALCAILGFTEDVDITESPFLCDNSGRVTKALLRQKAAGPIGHRFYDSTSSKEFRLVLSGTNILIDENTGTEDTPVWTNRATMALATGVWTFTGIPVGPASDPTTDNQFVRKAYEDAQLTTHTGAVTAHAAATNLEKVANKGAASGYAELDAGTKVPTAQLGGAGADATKFLRGDQSWQPISALTTQEAHLAADINLANPNTFYDAVSLNLSAGTYLLISAITFIGAAEYTMKLWNGTTVKASASDLKASGHHGTVPISCFLTLTGAETWKISVAATAGGALIKATPTVNAGGCDQTCTYLLALKIA